MIRPFFAQLREDVQAVLERDPAARNTLEVVLTYRGGTDVRSQANSCTPPQSGADTCCDACDYEVSVNVAKYGVLAPVPEDERPGARRREFADAIACDPAGDVLTQCRDFIPHVYRGHETRSFEYAWNGERQRFHVPRPDKLRETHPELRPADAEQQRKAPPNPPLPPQGRRKFRQKKPQVGGGGVPRAPPRRTRRGGRHHAKIYRVT